MNKEQITEEIKEKVALKHGYLLPMPTHWNYAMLITHRRKKQLLLYEEVIQEIWKYKILNG